MGVLPMNHGRDGRATQLRKNCISFFCIELSQETGVPI